MTVGTKFKGQINNEVFEIIKEQQKGERVYFKVKNLKSGKVYELPKQYVEHLQVEIINN